MSATLGKGGDLERLTGRKSIDRLEAPAGFKNAGVGRRFFIFPGLSLTGDETDGLRLGMQGRSGRSLILTPSDAQAKAHKTLVEEHLADYEVFDKDDIELDKQPFVASAKAVAILANRFDGIDFPGDECRILCIDGLPKAMNAQERFIMSKMGATALFNERIQTRILQAVGRCRGIAFGSVSSRRGRKTSKPDHERSERAQKFTLRSPSSRSNFQTR
jgi:hypothetical protein